MDSRQQPPWPSLAGRVPEQAIVRAAIQRAAAGKASAVFVHGESGVGKTRLVAEVTAPAGPDDTTVLWGSCLRFGAVSSPYLPLVGALESWFADAAPDDAAALLGAAPGLRDLLPSLAGGTAPDPSGRVAAAIDLALDWLAGQRVTVLVVDDLQWADVTSLDVLAYLIAGLRSQRLAVLLTIRDEGVAEGHPLHRWLADMRRMPAVVDLPLARLSEQETADQLRHALGVTAAPGLVADVWAQTQGNCYLTELLTVGVDPTADALPRDRPEELRGAVLAQWHGLCPAAREVSRVVSVAGRPVAPAVLEQVALAAGIPAPDVTRAVREAIASGVLHRDPHGTVWFRHPLLAEVLYGTLLPSEAATVHGSFADVISSAPVAGTRDLADLALHCSGAGRFDEAFELTLRAADAAAAVQAIPEVAALKYRAAELWPEVSPAVTARVTPLPRLLVEAAHAFRRAADHASALEALARARDLMDPDQDPLTASYVLRLLVRIRWVMGLDGNADIEMSQRAVDLSRTAPDSDEYAYALAGLAQALTHHQRDGYLLACDVAVEAAYRSGVPAAIAYALGIRAEAMAPGAQADAAEAYRVAVEAGDPEIIGLTCLARAMLLDAQGLLPESVETHAEGYRESGRHGMAAITAALGARLARHLVEVGRMAESRERLREVLARRPKGLTGLVAHSAALVLAIRQGHGDETEMHWARLEELSSTMLPSPDAPVVAEYWLAAGSADRALAVLLGNDDDPQLTPPEKAQLRFWAARVAADVGVAARDRGDTSAEQAAAEALQALHRRLKDPADSGPVGRAFDALGAAHASELTGSDERVALWRTAIEACQDAGMSYHATQARMQLARRLGSSSDGRNEAAALLRDTLATAESMGTAPLSQEIEAIARGSRISLSTPLPVLAGSPAAQRLTSRELEVLAQLVTGRTYAQIATALFISEKTVSVHVSNLLRKTGSASRQEASDWARRNRVLDG